MSLKSLSWYWPMFTFTVTTKVPDEQPRVPRPQVPSVLLHGVHTPHACPTFCLPLKCGSINGGGSQCLVLPPRVQSSEQQGPGQSAQSNGSLSLLHLKVVSSPALITDERWVILSGEDARMP